MIHGNMKIVDLVSSNHVTKLGLFSFSNCKGLSKVIIPTSITEIPYCCFEHCSKLKSIKLPENIFISSMGFYNCPIQPTNRLISINWKTIKKLGGKFIHCLRCISGL